MPSFRIDIYVNHTDQQITVAAVDIAAPKTPRVGISASEIAMWIIAVMPNTNAVVRSSPDITSSIAFEPVNTTTAWLMHSTSNGSGEPTKSSPNNPIAN